MGKHKKNINKVIIDSAIALQRRVVELEKVIEKRDRRIKELEQGIAKIEGLKNLNKV